ncbi:MAG: putative metal-binding motif-containing protein, partial [Myxococcales bacterium]|nr:putative metal-binding motif-containing protein [Myxococcales bacterium]
DEEADRCETDCGVTRDADGDGSRARECGGDDCDDADDRRHPGATEVCDVEGLDEDCDPATFGERDVDEDGVFDARCCNGDVCGTDCDDSDAAVRPSGVEVCDEVDQDCDGSVDEGVQTTFYRDGDRDGFGAGDTAQACTRPDGYAPTDDDCDDGDPAVHPAAFDRCDGSVDDDCSGDVDDPPGGCACTDGDTRTCPFAGVCAGSTQACTEGLWGACGVGGVDEICANELDDDCDGAVDERCACEVASRVCGSDTGACMRGVQDCEADGSWGPCVGDVRATPEVCNTVDDDCDGRSDEGLTLRCWVDEDGDGYAWPSAMQSEACGACPAGTTARDPSVIPDCDGNDARAFPGQTAYFGTPRTASGGFDFDCDGSEDSETPGPCRLNAAGDDCAFERSWTSTTCGEYTPLDTCVYMGPEAGCVEIRTCTPFVGSTCDRVRCR